MQARERVGGLECGVDVLRVVIGVENREQGSGDKVQLMTNWIISTAPATE